MQGNGFRDQQEKFDSAGVQILGCSFDDAAANQAFAKKFGYSFPLLCDTDRKIGMAYGAAKAPDAGHAARITYVIDEKGNVAQALEKVDPSTHTDDILALIG